MKVLVGIARIIVGVLFIFSGFIKLNDPVGFSYKLQEYFSADVLNFEFLAPYALLIAILLVVLEVLLGIALLLGYAKKITLWLLLLMIGFFTFLTFYSAYFEKVTDCGCFGDAIPLVPWESFAKDVILLMLILFLFFSQKSITPLFTKGIRSMLILVSFFGCMLFGYYVLMHLPWLDFRPYHEGANISEGMRIPDGAPQAIFEYKWRFDVDGEEQIVTTTGGYPDIKGTLINYETTLLQKGYEPPIHDFTIERGETDFTEQFLAEPHLIMVVAYDLTKTESEGYYAIKKVTEEAVRKGYKVIGMTSSGETVKRDFLEKYKLPFSFYFTDETTLKTIVRSNPGILKIENGTIVQKLHWNDAESLRLTTLETEQPNLNFKLKYTLDSIAVLDQRYRKLMQIEDTEELKVTAESMGLNPEDYTGDLWKRQEALDTSNLRMITNILDREGYPGKSVVGEPTNTAAWYVIQHSDKIGEYLPLMKKAGREEELPYRLVAMMEDRYLMYQDKPQIYGTQGSCYGDAPCFIWPIENPETVNTRRQQAGFTRDIETYSKALFGDDFDYKVITVEAAQAMKQNAMTHHQ